MFKKLLVVGAGLAAGAVATGVVTAQGAWRRWGVDDAERAMALPGDDLVPDANGADTRGIDIAAPPEAVWPWLLQMGYGRAGWYSYDQLDMNHPSAERIVPEWQSIAVGDVLPTDPGGGFEVRVVEPDHALVAYLDRALVEGQRGRTETPPEGGQSAVDGIEFASANVRATGAALDRAVPGDFAASWAFVLEPRDGATRLVERFRVRMEPPAAPTGMPAKMPELLRTLLGFGVFVMVRRQMLGIRDRAEGRQGRVPSLQPVS